jgi:alkylhydroperoxidase family enzyme
MRLPYAPSSPPASDTAAAEVYAAVAARRAPRPLQPLDLALLHAPPIASGWNSFLGAVRTRNSLTTDVRELAICRVAVLNGAAYEWAHHAPIARGGGVSEEGILTVKDADVKERGKAQIRNEGGGLSQKQWAVLEYTDQMTRGVKVEDEVFDNLKALFSEQEVVEITATVAAYNCVSRFLVALDVGEHNAMQIE